jgi:proteasome accessory factor B
MPEQPTNLNLAAIVHRLLTRPRGWRVTELMQTLDIRDRTYRKYRQLLQRDFEPLLSDGEPMVREVRDSDGVWLRLVDPEPIHAEANDFAARVAALHLARLTLGFADNTDVGAALGHLIDEFRLRTADRAFVFDHLLHNLDRLFHVVPFGAKSYARRRSELSVLLRALLFRKQVIIDYDSVTSPRRKRRIEPWTLLSYRSGLYIVGCDAGSDQTRTWAVDRIESVQMTNERFEYPDSDTWCPMDYTEGAFGLFRDVDVDPIEVDLVFSGERWMLTDLTERDWHPSQRFEWLAPDQVRMTFTVRSLREVAPWVRSYGSAVEVVHPPLDSPLWTDSPRSMPR